MNRKARYVVKWWLLGVLVFTSLMPGQSEHKPLRTHPLDRPPRFCLSCRNQALLLKLPGRWPAQIPSGQVGPRSRSRQRTTWRLIAMSGATACSIRNGTAPLNPTFLTKCR